MSISLVLEHKINCHWSIILLDQTVLQVDRQDGLGGGGWLFGGGDYFKYFHVRDAINQGTSIIRGNMVVWVFCTIKWRGKKCKREKEQEVPAIRTCVFACCPPGSQNVNCHYVTKHFSLFRVSRRKQCAGKGNYRFLRPNSTKIKTSFPSKWPRLNSSKQKR